MVTVVRRSYLISVSERGKTARTAMRNALFRLNGKEVLPGLFWVALTDEERAALGRQFGKVRIRAN
jgi:hypothetical protein